MIMANLTNLVKGGIGDYAVPENVDAVELAIGVQTEMEHTNDVKIAKEIALDHLTEDPEYYTKLAKAGLSHDFNSIPSSGYGDPDAGFNDVSRTGGNQLNNTNMGGTIGNTSDGQVCGRRSEPVHNKTIDIELQEKTKKSPTPKNQKLWDKAISLAKRKFDVYPSKYANLWASNWYKKNGGQWSVSESYDELSPKQIKEIFNRISDFIKESKNKDNIMKKSRLKREIKKIVRDSFLKENEDVGDDLEVSAEKETVTLTLDKDLARSLHDVLMSVLQDDDQNSTEDSIDSQESELTPVDGESQDYSDEDDVPEEESDVVSEAKKIVSNLKKRKYI